MQYIFTLGGWDGAQCRSDVAIYSPDGAPSTHLAPNASESPLMSSRDEDPGRCIAQNPERVGCGGRDLRGVLTGACCLLGTQGRCCLRATVWRRSSPNPIPSTLNPQPSTLNPEP